MNKLDVFLKLNKWLEKNQFESYDVCDINSNRLYYYLISLKQKIYFGKYIFYPFFYLSKRHADIFRKLFYIKKQKFPQAQAIICRAYLSHYQSTNEEIWLSKAKALLDWLRKKRVKDYKYFCWGQPYDWYSKQLIPLNTPRTTVTSQVAEAFLDAYEITNDTKYLDVAISVCNFYIDDLNWKYDGQEHICFSYTTVDDFAIHNANMLASAVLIRTWYHCKQAKYKSMGIKALDFTMKYQNKDGSWYYWMLPDNLPNIIDNYHTGFVLESLETIRKYLDREFLYDDNLNKGINFYLENLFEKNDVPKLTPDSLYPIDIQSCAQSIITLGVILKRYPELREKADNVLKWTYNEMYDGTGFFYYRIYKDGWKDKTPYIRWAESWMLRALTF